MATIASELNKQKITVTIPVALLNRLDDRISKRQRSNFIAEAIAERLALEEQVAALEETAGLWADKDHPELADGEAIDRWVSTMRQNWTLSVEGSSDHGNTTD